MISGNVTNAIKSLADEFSKSDQSEIKEIQAMLSQLQEAIENAADLSESQRGILLEKLGSLIETVKTSGSEKRSEPIQDTKTLFSAVLKGLPGVTTIMDLLNKSLTLIEKLPGLGM